MGKIIRLKDTCKHIKPFTATIVGGGFDLFHIGHLKCLKKCASFGKPFIVVVQSDKTVRIRKGPNRPVIVQKERAEIISHLSFVDYVIILDKAFYDLNYLKIIKPKILCFSRENLRFRKLALFNIQKKFPQMKGIFIPKQSKKTSTSFLIDKIISSGKNKYKPKDKILAKLSKIAGGGQSVIGRTSALIKLNGKIIAQCCNEDEYHAEELAIEKAIKLKNNLNDCELYSLLRPCLLCAQKIVENKISKVYYIYDYGLSGRIEFLKKNNIKIEKYKLLDH